MSYNPMTPLNAFPQYFFDPNSQNAQFSGYPFPYNVLNVPPFYGGVKTSMHPKSGVPPHDVYHKHPTEPNQEELEKEHKEMMETQWQKNNIVQESKEPHSEEKKEKPKQNALISFDTLTAGTIQSSSGVFNGKNIQFGWSSHSKTNNGFGTVGGSSNIFRNNINVVFDNDEVDTPTDDRLSPAPTS